MPQRTNDLKEKVDFIESVSVLLRGIEPKLDADFKTVLSTIGNDGCQYVYDKLVNYIDDLSNIDTCEIESLVSFVETLGFAFKDKTTVDTLRRLVGCEYSVLFRKSLFLLSQTSISNIKACAERFGISFEQNFSSRSEYISKIVDVLKEEIKAFVKTSYVNSGPNVLLSPIVLRHILKIKNGKHIYTRDHYINFGIYTDTIFEYVIIKIIDEIWGLNSIQNEKPVGIDIIPFFNSFIKTNFPFLFDRTLFNPIQFALTQLSGGVEDFGYNYNKQLSYPELTEKESNEVSRYKDIISNYSGRLFKEYFFNDKWIQGIQANKHIFKEIELVSFFSVLQKILSEDINPIRYIVNFEKSDINLLFSDIDLEGNSSIIDILKTRFWGVFSNKNPALGFFKISEDGSMDETLIDSWVDDVLNLLIKFSNDIVLLREYTKLRVIRNSFKGTNAIVQFAVAEYLNQNLPNLIENTIDAEIVRGKKEWDYFDLRNEKLKPSGGGSVSLKEKLDKIYKDGVYNTDDIKIIEYWDRTDYFDLKPTFSPWADNLNVANDTNNLGIQQEGDLSRDVILDFYRNMLNLNDKVISGVVSSGKSIRNGVVFNNIPTNLTETEKNTIYKRLVSFLIHVYNSGILRKNDWDSNTIFEKENDSQKISPIYFSRQVHPYIFNFVSSSEDLKMSLGGTDVSESFEGLNYGSLSGGVSLLISSNSLERLKDVIDSNYKNVISFWKLNSDEFTDNTGYITRYEAFGHTNNYSSEFWDDVNAFSGKKYPEFSGTSYSNEEDLLRWYTYQNNELVDESERLLEQNAWSDANLNLSFNSSNLKDFVVTSDGTSYGVLNDFITFKKINQPFHRRMGFFPKIYTIDYENQNGEVVLKTTNGGELYTLHNTKFGSTTFDKIPKIIISESGKYLLIGNPEKFNKNVVSFFVFLQTMFYNNGKKEIALELICEVELFSFNKSSETEPLLRWKTNENSFVVLIGDKNSKNFIFWNISPSEPSITYYNFELSSENDFNEKDSFDLGLSLVDSDERNNYTNCLVSFVSTKGEDLNKEGVSIDADC